MTKIISILISLCMILNACTTDKTTIKPNPVVTRNGQDNNPDSNSKPPTPETHNIKEQSKDNFSNKNQIKNNQDFTLKKTQQKSVDTVNTTNTLVTPIKSNPNITKDITPKTPPEKENTINESNDSISKSSILDSISPKKESTINKNDDSISKSSILDSISPEEESTINEKDSDTNDTKEIDNKLDQQEPSTFSTLNSTISNTPIKNNKKEQTQKNLEITPKPNTKLIRYLGYTLAGILTLVAGTIITLLIVYITVKKRNVRDILQDENIYNMEIPDFIF